MNLETVLQSGNTPDSKLYMDFLDSFTKVTTNLNEWLENRNTIVAGKANGYIKLDENLLERINHLLEEGSPEAEKLLVRINLDALDYESAELISIVLKNVQNYDFLNAQSSLSKLSISTIDN